MDSVWNNLLCIFRMFGDINKTIHVAMKWMGFVILVLIGVSCSDDDRLLDPSPPVFSVTPVAFDQITSFIAFGDALTPTQLNPAIEYFSDQVGAQVRSVSNGIVVDIRMNTNVDDLEVWIRPTADSKWLIIYDHIIDPEITIGDQVSAEQHLGGIGVGGRTELQINDNQNLAHCPLGFGTPDFVQEHIDFSEKWCIAETVIP